MYHHYNNVTSNLFLHNVHGFSYAIEFRTINEPMKVGNNLLSVILTVFTYLVQQYTE